MKKQFYLDLALMLWTWILIGILILLVGCEQPKARELADCTSKRITLQMRDGRTIMLPASGRAVMESHYVTNDDVFPVGVYPSFIDEHIEFHLKESCGLLKKFGAKGDCEDVYHNRYARQWTPAEGGQIGQGSRGRHRLSLESELWAATMNLKSNFQPNTRLLVHFGGKSLVLSIGHEIGPSTTRHIMGMSPEAHWYLGTDNDTYLQVELPLNQSLPFGPIDCMK